MYISRLRLDPQNRQTMRALAEPKLFHGAIERGFAGPRQRNLWRIDRLGDAYYLLVISPNRPDFSAAAAQFGYPGAEPAWQTKDYTPLLNRVENGSRWHFRLTANPVCRTAGNAETGARGKILAHATPEHQQRWLRKKAPAHGFFLEEDAFLVVNSRWIQFCKPGVENRTISLQAATFEGLLTVTDAERFRRTLTEGVGRGKAYGLGLLTIVR